MPNEPFMPIAHVTDDTLITVADGSTITLGEARARSAIQNEKDASEVAQSDRDAFISAYGAMETRLCDHDMSILLHAFARHRLTTRPPAPEDAGAVERETYRQMHDIATNDLGYASILEALEATPHAAAKIVEPDHLKSAIDSMVGRYVGLIKSGDEASWDPAAEARVALAALSRLDGEVGA